MPRKSKKQNLSYNNAGNSNANTNKGYSDDNANATSDSNNWNTPNSDSGYTNNSGNSNGGNKNAAPPKKKATKATKAAAKPAKASAASRKPKKQAKSRVEDDDDTADYSSYSANYNGQSNSNYGADNQPANKKRGVASNSDDYDNSPPTGRSQADSDDTSYDQAPKQLAPEDSGIVVTDVESVKIEEVGAQIIDRVVAFELQRGRARYHSMQSIMEKVVRYNPLFYANFLHPYIMQNAPAWKKFSAYITGRVAWPAGDIRANLVEFKVLKKIADDIVLNRLTSNPLPRPRFDFKRV